MKKLLSITFVGVTLTHEMSSPVRHFADSHAIVDWRIDSLGGRITTTDRSFRPPEHWCAWISMVERSNCRIDPGVGEQVRYRESGSPSGADERGNRLDLPTFAEGSRGG